MKFATTLVSAFAIASAFSGALPAFAQDHMINGNAVAAEQIPAVQQKCDDLRAAGSGSAAMSASAGGGNANGGSAAASNGAAGGSGASSGSAGTTSGGSNTSAGQGSQGTDVDLNSLTVAMCDQGGFAATAK